MYCRTHRKVVNFHGESDAKSNKNKKKPGVREIANNSTKKPIICVGGASNLISFSSGMMVNSVNTAFFLNSACTHINAVPTKGVCSDK
jgi:hypothetical protein